jgi:hypothetical protein
LPDGLFSNQKSQFGYILEGLEIGIFYGHLEYDTHLVYLKDILYIFWSFGTFFPFWYVVPRKIWQPCLTDAAPRKKIAFDWL